MLVDRLASGDGEGIGAHGLDAGMISAGLDGLLDVGGDALLELGEELVLLVDGERQEPVQEPGHRRQLLLEAAFVGELEAGRLLEAVDGPARDAPEPERAVELAQRHLRIQALEVVALAKEHLVVAAHRGLRIALPARDGAERVQPARDRGDESLLPLHIGGHPRVGDRVRGDVLEPAAESLLGDHHRADNVVPLRRPRIH